MHRDLGTARSRRRRSAFLGRVAVTSAVAVLAVEGLLAVSAARPGTDAGAVPPDLTGAPAGAGLDRAGLRIPGSRYALPSGAVFLSPRGSDAAPGDRARPVRTLARAFALAPAGGTVVVRGGTYRDGDLDTDKAVSLQAYPGEQPWFDGTDVVTAWQARGSGQWSTPWSTPDLCQNAQHPDGGFDDQVWPWQGQAGPDGPCVHPDMVRDPANPAAADPQMVFADGRELRQVTSLGDVQGPTFYDDTRNHRIWIGLDPHRRTLELTRRPHALVSRARTGFSVRGIGFRRYATNEKHEASATHGAVDVVSTPGVTFRDDAFVANAGAGLNLIGAARDVTVDHVVFARNGANGLDANGSEDRDHLTIENSVFEGNNAQLFGLGCGASCSAAGVKLAHMDQVLVRDNLFADGRGAASGFWCDLHCTRTTIVGNVFSSNGDYGVIYEVSDTALIRSNLFYGNGQYVGRRRPRGTRQDSSDKGGGLRLSSAHSRVRSNTFVDNVSALVVYDDERSPGASCRGCDAHSVGPDTRANDVEDNVFATTTRPVPEDSWLVASLRRETGATVGVPGTNPSEYYAVLDHDTYLRPPGSEVPLQRWTTGAGDASLSDGHLSTVSYLSLDSFQRASGLEPAGQVLSADAASVFDDPSRGRYCTRRSVALDSGRRPDEQDARLLALPEPAPRGAPGWLGSVCP